MHRMKSTERRQHMVAHSFSSSEEDISLGAGRHRVMLPLLQWFHSAEVACLHSRVNSPESTRHNGRMTSQCKFV